MSASKASLGILFLVVATELIGFGLIIPVLPQIAISFEADPTLLGVLMAAYSFAQFIAAPLLGALSDKYGRKPLLVISKLGTVFAYILLALSQSYVLFLIARLLDGFTGGNISVARAYVADVTSAENRSKGMAVIGIAFGTGFVLGPALGGFLFREGGGHFVPALVAGSLSLIAAILTILFLKEPEKRQESKSAASQLVSGISCDIFVRYWVCKFVSSVFVVCKGGVT
jgi:DHA1 family tetracycline resistance protein-like MFS transporter